MTLRIGGSDYGCFYGGSVTGINDRTSGGKIVESSDGQVAARTSKLPNIPREGYFAVGGSNDTEYDAAFRALMNAARRAGIADVKAQAQFAVGIIGEPTAVNRRQFTLKYGDTSQIKPNQTVTGDEFKKMNGQVNHLELSDSDVAALRQFRAEYVNNGGRVLSKKEIDAQITVAEKQLVARPPYSTQKDAAVNNAADVDGVFAPNAAATIKDDFKLPNVSEPLNDRALLGYIEKHYGFEKTEMWGSDAAAIRDAAKAAGVKFEKIEVRGQTPANQIAFVEISRADAQKVANLAHKQRAELTKTQAIVKDAIDKTVAESFMRGFFKGAYNDLKGNAATVGQIGAALADPIGTAKTIYAAVAELPRFGAELMNGVGTTAATIARMSPAQMTAFAQELVKNGCTELANLDGSALFEKLGEVAGTVAMEALLGKGVSLAFKAFAATKTGAALIGEAEKVGASVVAKVAHYVSDEQAAAALEKIRRAAESPLIMNMGGLGTVAELLPEYAKVTSNILVKYSAMGVVKFERYANQMISSCGEQVKPYLEKLFRDEMTTLNLKVNEKEIESVKDVWKAQEINPKVGVNREEELKGLDFEKRAEFRKQVHEAKTYPDRFKHVVTAKSNEEARVISMTGSDPAAQYTLEFRKGVESRERAAMQEAIQNGMFKKQGGSFYFFKKFDEPIGYNKGKATQWMRVELTDDGTFHGFPASLQQVKDKFPDIKE